jgi:hypothetical protein
VSGVGDENTIAGLRFPNLHTAEFAGPLAAKAHLLAAPALRDLRLFGWATTESLGLTVAAFAPSLVSLTVEECRYLFGRVLARAQC